MTWSQAMNPARRWIRQAARTGPAHPPPRPVLAGGRFLAAPIALGILTACSDLAAPPTADGSAAQFAHATQSVGVVMSGLNSPRGLAWGPDGALYVAEAGMTVTNGPCIPAMEGPNLVTRCFSSTGSVSRLRHGRQERVLDGLPSSYFVETGFASGPQHVAFQGLGNMYVALGCGCTSAERAALGSGAELLGTLVDFNPAGKWRVVADIVDYEGTYNPAGGPVDANPFGILPEGNGVWVVDAGGNSLLRVSKQGEVGFVTSFPTTPAFPPFDQSEPVPTRVKHGPDGALYVSTLSGVPFIAGAAAIYRIVPGQPPQLWAGGFKTITDFAFAPDGSVYVVQFASGPVFFTGPGQLIRRAPDDTRTILAADLFQPTGVVVAPDGSVYVANKGTLSGQGEVIRYAW